MLHYLTPLCQTQYAKIAQRLKIIVINLIAINILRSFRDFPLVFLYVKLIGKVVFPKTKKVDL